MELPRMIAFDYGQTLLDELPFDPLAGTRAVLRYAVTNPEHADAERIQHLAEELNRELGRGTTGQLADFHVEAPNIMFQKYLYEYFGIELSLSSTEVDKMFLDHASPAVRTPGVAQMLDRLESLGIRTAVFSNNAFSGTAIADRLAILIPDHRFDFILTSSEYLFRKPHPRAFEILLRKAGLSAGEVWYCGDDVECDVCGAAAFGIQAVWYRGAEKHVQIPPECPHLEIKHWSELENILLALRKPRRKT